MASTPIDPAFLAPQLPELNGITHVTGGGQKSVYRAVHAKHGPVALKVFSDSADPERTKREIAAVQRIANPHVPVIYGTGLLAGTAKPCFWLIEPWLDGDNLRTRLAAGALSDDLVLRMARDVLYVLSEAEQQQIVHRDVKPENIVIDPSNTKCWLLDFGIARVLDMSTLTRAGPYQGPLSAGYAPPEQIQNRADRIDARTDLYALGVTLYEAMTGVNPFRDGAKDAAEVLHRVMNTELPRPPRDIDAAGSFSDLVMVMTRARRTHRPRTAAKAYTWVNGI